MTWKGFDCKILSSRPLECHKRLLPTSPTQRSCLFLATARMARTRRTASRASARTGSSAAPMASASSRRGSATATTTAPTDRMRPTAPRWPTGDSRSPSFPFRRSLKVKLFVASSISIGSLGSRPP